MRKYQCYDQLARLWDLNGTSTKLYALYRKQIEDEDFDFKYIKEELEADFERYKKDGEADCLMNEYDIEEDGADPCFGVYVGSILHISPSGKFYLPFARSNVSDKEMLKDQIYWEALNDFLEDHDLYFS